MADSSDNIDYESTANVARLHAAAAREKPVPKMGDTPISLAAVMAIAAIAVFAGGFTDNLSFNGGNSNINGYHYVAEPPEGVAPVDTTLPPDVLRQPENWIAIGKEVYGSNCNSCHQPDGGGTAGVYPHLRGSEFVIGGEKRLVAILLHGITGSLTVDGKTFNGSMQPLGTTPLSSNQLAQVLSYIRNSWGNKGSVLYEDQINKLKKELGGRPNYTESELRALDANAPAPPSDWPAKIQAAGAAGAAAGTPVGTPPAAGAPAAGTTPPAAPAPK